MQDVPFLASLILAPLSEEILVNKYFQSTHPKLDEFLYKNALFHREIKLAQTEIVVFKSQPIGYFTLLNDSIRLPKNKIRKHFKYPHPIYESYPAIKIGRMATHKDYAHKGIGTFMVLHSILKAFLINNN